MTEQELIELCSIGESTTVQYKLDFTTPKQIAEELVAFANTRGGYIVFGAEDKTGKMVGLTYEQVQFLSRELGNTANDQVRPVIYLDTETVKQNNLLFMVTYVKSGAYKPYKDLAGNIWVKQGADKRRVTENAEIRRLLQNSHQYQVDTDGVDGTSEDNIDTKALDAYFNHVYQKRADEFNIPYKNVLRNAHITDDLGRLTTAGTMYFAKDPQQFLPQHCIKGSGIPRVVATKCDVDFIDRPDGNQFIARIWLTDQKNKITTQKALDALDSTNQKTGTTIRKPLNTTQKRILEYLKDYPKATRIEIADALGDITESGVKFNIGLLQQHGYLRRRNGRKDGYWEINDIKYKDKRKALR